MNTLNTTAALTEEEAAIKECGECAELIASMRNGIRAIGTIPSAYRDALDQAEKALRKRSEQLKKSMLSRHKKTGKEAA